MTPLRRLKSRTGVFSAVRQPDLTDGWIQPALNWALAHGPWDVVVSSGGPPAAHLVALGINGKCRGGLWAADFRDLWTDNHIYTGLFPFTLAERNRERRVLANVDRLVTVSPGLARRLAAKSGRSVEVIYNGYDSEAFAELSPAPTFPDDGRVRLVYTGTVYDRGQDLDALCSAVAAEPTRYPGRRVRPSRLVDRGGATDGARRSSRLSRIGLASGSAANAAGCERTCPARLVRPATRGVDGQGVRVPDVNGPDLGHRRRGELAGGSTGPRGEPRRCAWLQSTSDSRGDPRACGRQTAECRAEPNVHCGTDAGRTGAAILGFADVRR